MRVRNKRSIIFDIECKFDIGRKLAGLSLSKPFFFSKGVTDATLKEKEKTPSLKDKFTKLVIIGAKMSEQAFSNDVGIVSIAEDFAGVAVINFTTSSTVQGFNV